MRAWYCVIKCDRDVVSFVLWEDHFIKPSTCPHAAEMGDLREAARDNIILVIKFLNYKPNKVHELLMRNNPISSFWNHVF